MIKFIRKTAGNTAAEAGSAWFIQNQHGFRCTNCSGCLKKQMGRQGMVAKLLLTIHKYSNSFWAPKMFLVWSLWWKLADPQSTSNHWRISCECKCLVSNALIDVPQRIMISGYCLCTVSPALPMFSWVSSHQHPTDNAHKWSFYAQVLIIRIYVLHAYGALWCSDVTSWMYFHLPPSCSQDRLQKHLDPAATEDEWRNKPYEIWNYAVNKQSFRINVKVILYYKFPRSVLMMNPSIFSNHYILVSVSTDPEPFTGMTPGWHHIWSCFKWKHCALTSFIST